MDAAYERMAKAQKKLEGILAASRPGLGGSLKDFVDGTLGRLAQDPDLCTTHDQAFLAAMEKATAVRRAVVKSARQRLIQMSLATELKGGRLQWHPIRPGSGKVEQRLTQFERQLLAGFNAALLSELVMPGALAVSSSPNYVDHRLFTAKSWRDVYHHDAKGKCTGWTRHEAQGVTDFTEDGLIVLERDAAGRPIKAQTIRYRKVEATTWGRPDKLEAIPGGEVVTYSYEGGQRLEKSRVGAKGKE
jgi:hypothetical protein